MTRRKAEGAVWFRWYRKPWVYFIFYHRVCEMSGEVLTWTGSQECLRMSVVHPPSSFLVKVTSLPKPTIRLLVRAYCFPLTHQPTSTKCFRWSLKRQQRQDLGSNRVRLPFLDTAELKAGAEVGTVQSERCHTCFSRLQSELSTWEKIKLNTSPSAAIACNTSMQHVAPGCKYSRPRWVASKVTAERKLKLSAIDTWDCNCNCNASRVSAERLFKGICHFEASLPWTEFNARSQWR